MLFLSRRFSRVRSATTSFNAAASWRRSLYLAGGRRTRRVSCQPAFAGLQEPLGPAVIHRGGDALAAAQLGDVLLAPQPLQHDTDLFPLPNNAGVVWRRMSFNTCSAGALPDQDFCFIFAPYGYDEPEILHS
jgi:hypothetical protein